MKMNLSLLVLVIVQAWLCVGFPDTCPFGSGTGMSVPDRIKAADIVVQVKVCTDTW